MRREKLNTLNERDLIIGLITSDKICREVCPIIKPRFLEIEYARVIATWIQDFYNEFKIAPKRDIIKLYRAHVEELTDESLQENVLTFIEKINDDYENLKNFNEDYVLKQSILYLKIRSLKNMAEDIDAYLLSGNIEKAEDIITQYRTVEKSSGESVSILKNTEALINAYAEKKEALFKIPGAYGKVIGDIHRGDFISFLAPPKRGKTWALIDVAVHAVMSGLKVLFVTLEMSEADVLRRFWTSLSGQPAEDKNDINYPFFVEDGDKFTVEYKMISKKGVNPSQIERRQKDLRRMYRGGDIRILPVPAYSLTCEQLEVKTERLIQQENFIPDVTIIDYADIMAPSERGDYRNQLDGIWKRLRGRALKRNEVTVSASQSGRASIGKDVNSTDIAEDIRKLAHVTSMVSLNQSEVEKKNGILRLKQLAIREGEQQFTQAVCTQCLSIGRIITDSKYENEVILEFRNDSDGSEKIRRKRRI